MGEWYYASAVAGSRARGSGLGIRGSGLGARDSAARDSDSRHGIAQLSPQSSWHSIDLAATQWQILRNRAPTASAAERMQEMSMADRSRAIGTWMRGRSAMDLSLCAYELAQVPAATERFELQLTDAAGRGVGPVERRGRTRLRHGRPVPRITCESRSARWLSWRRSSKSHDAWLRHDDAVQRGSSSISTRTDSCSTVSPRSVGADGSNGSGSRLALLASSCSRARDACLCVFAERTSCDVGRRRGSLTGVRNSAGPRTADPGPANPESRARRYT